MANPVPGIHVTSGATAVNAFAWTSPSGSNSAATGSSFVAWFVSNGTAGTTTVADTVNGSSTGNTYALPTPSQGTGANPIIDTGDGYYLYYYLCTNGAGGTNHEVTITTTSDKIIVAGFFEVQSANTTTPLDASATAYGVTSPVACIVTPSGSGDMIVGIGICASNRAITASTGGYTTWDQIVNASGLGSAGVSYLTGATSSSQNPAMTNPSNDKLAVATLAFAPSSGGGGGGGGTSYYYLGSQNFY